MSTIQEIGCSKVIVCTRLRKKFHLAAGTLLCHRHVLYDTHHLHCGNMLMIILVRRHRLKRCVPLSFNNLMLPALHRGRNRTETLIRLPQDGSATPGSPRAVPKIAAARSNSTDLTAFAKASAIVEPNSSRMRGAKLACNSISNTADDHRAALKEIETLMTAEMDTPEGDRLDVLATLVEAYEAKHFSMAPAEPIDAIKFIMEAS